MPGAFEESTEPPVYPPLGYFPPPNASRSRPRSGTASSQRPASRGTDRGRADSPFDYSYVHSPPPASRHASDPVSPPHEEEWAPYPSTSASAPSMHSPHSVDPFQYMTAGPRAPYHSGAVAARRHAAGQQDAGHANIPRGSAPAAARGGRGARHVSSEGTSSEATEAEDESASDDLGHGARVRERSSGSRSREDIMVEVEPPDPEPEPEPAPKPKKSSSGSSPVKRKPVAGGSGNSGRRRKR